MAHKHNRRRIRPRSRHHNILVSKSLFDQSLFSEPRTASATEPPDISATGIYPSTGDYRFGSLDPMATATVTKSSHNLDNAWQIRMRRQAEQAVRLEREQIKLFGGVPGDDVGLCFLMLEYFGGLDFIDA
jgi:hypothetical protein